jgi:hypothetical protein
MSINAIKYNGTEIGSPTPFVTLERSHVFNGQKLGNVDKIKLIGQLTGRYSDLTGYQQGLINNFNQDFKTFEILEGISGINLQSECDANIFLSKINDFYYQSNSTVSKDICPLKANQTIKITANDSATSDNFGKSVSLNSIGNVALVGAHFEDPNGITNAGAAYIFTGSGNSWVQTAKITGNDAQTSDFFGYSVSLNSAGNVALVGAYGEDPNGINAAGSAYVFTGRGNSWVQTAKITGNDAEADDNFGWSVSLNSGGNVALIGAYSEDPNGINAAGSAYIFTGSGNSWVQTAKITGNDAQILDLFGWSASLNSAGNVALIGAFNEDPNGITNAGAAYIFTGSGNSWVQTAKISANDAGSSDGFGFSVCLNSIGNVALIGANREDPDGVSDAGSAYIFTGSGNSWIQVAKITGNNAEANGRFASSVSLNSAGNIALIGASFEDPNGAAQAGSAYIFTGSGNSWIQTAKITGSNGQALGFFGGSVSLNSIGNIALIGAQLEAPNGIFDAGSAYIFDISKNCGNIYIKNSGNNWYYGATELGQYSCAFGLGSQSIYPWEASWSQCFGGLNCNPINIQPVYENILYKKSGVIVNSINFSEGVYNGILKYEVDLVAKDFDYNVQNPVNQFTINKQNNTLILNHNVSAQGINTSSTNYSNSLNNAISFVNQFTGLNAIPNLYIEENIGLPEEIIITNNVFYSGKYKKINQGNDLIYWSKIDEPSISIFRPNYFGYPSWTLLSSNPEHPTYINPSKNKEAFPIYNWDSLNIYINSGEFILLEQKESINRIDSTYSIQEIYTKDLHSDHANYGILRYTTEYNSGAEQDVVNFSIKGQYSDSAINGDFEELKSGFNSDIKPNLFSKLSGNIDSFYSGYINPIPISYSVNENSGSHSIDFQFEYDNLNLPNPYISYTSNISRDEISQIISVNLNADIIVRGGSLASRYATAQSTYSSAVNALNDIASYLYSGFIEFNGYNFSYPLRRLKLDTKDNKSLGKISLSATFDDKETPYNAAEADYSVNKQLPVWYFSQNATLQRNNYIFQDFDIHTPLRSSYDINVKTKQGINVMPETIGDELLYPQEGEIKNKKFNYQKEKDGRIRSIKTTIEVISKDSSAAFPKDII